MRTRAPKPPRDPLAPDAIERYLDQHGMVRLLAVTAVMAATFVIAGMAAIAFLTVVLVTAEQVAPSAPAAVLDLVAPAPAPTDHVGSAAAPVTPSQAPVRRAAVAPGRSTTPSPLAPLAPTTSVLGVAAPSVLSPARPSLATARSATSAASWAASVLTSAAPAAKTPPSEPAAAPMAAPAARPTVAPTTSPSATTAPTATPAPAPSATTTAPPTASDRGKAHHHKRCTPRKHRKGKC